MWTRRNNDRHSGLTEVFIYITGLSDLVHMVEILKIAYDGS